jgi:transcriptional regulator with XRE-family HTH domain
LANALGTFGRRRSGRVSFESRFARGLLGYPYGKLTLTDDGRKRYEYRVCNLIAFRAATVMEIGRRLRELRECRHLSQGDLERRTGLLRCYTSRVENGHTVPSVETIEKYAIALEIPLVTFFSKNLSSPPAAPPPFIEDSRRRPTLKERLQKQQLATALAALDSQDKQLLVAFAERLAKGKRVKRHKPARRAVLPVEMRRTK